MIACLYAYVRIKTKKEKFKEPNPEANTGEENGSFRILKVGLTDIPLQASRGANKATTKRCFPPVILGGYHSRGASGADFMVMEYANGI